jgi:hypothetical protein
MNKAFDARMDRAISQKLYLVESYETNEINKRQYAIMGSTGNVYTVTITAESTCTCPDYTTRHKRCKHLFFVLKRIMNVNDPFQENYTDDELVNMFKNIPIVTHCLCVGDSVKNKYDKLKSNNGLVVAKDVNDDVCPICLDDLEGDNQNLDYCKYSCGKYIHSHCYDMMYINQANATRLCVFCRAPWNKDNNSKYINLID